MAKTYHATQQIRCFLGGRTNKEKLIAGVDAMTIDELRAHLKHLIETYAPSSGKLELLTLVTRNNIPVKYILAEITPSLSGVITVDDRTILEEVVFYFC